jgi:hypothetical protein
VMWKAPVFENVDHARRDWPRMRPADASETQLQSSMQRRLRDCLTHHADSRRLGAVGMPFASVCGAYAETVHTYDILLLCLSLRRLRLLGLPTSVSPIRWSRTETMPLTATSRGEVYRSSPKAKDEFSLSGQWTRYRDSQVVMEPIPLICRSATVHKKTNVFCYSRAHGSGGRRGRALCKKWTAPRQTRHASRSGDMQAHASRRIKRLCSQQARQPAANL